jgi:hypothetical protein
MFGVMPFAEPVPGWEPIGPDAIYHYADDKIYSLGSLAHPEWPYTGTPHEWCVKPGRA